MKNKILIATAFLLLAFVNCKKTGPSANVNLAGTWKNVQTSFNYYGDEIVYDVKEFPCLANFEVAIRPDSTFTQRYIGADTCFVNNDAGVSTLFPFTWLYSPDDKPVSGTIDKNAGGYRFLSDSGYFVQVSTKTSGSTEQLVMTDKIDGNTSVVWTYIFERKQ